MALATVDKGHPGPEWTVEREREECLQSVGDPDSRGRGWGLATGINPGPRSIWHRVGGQLAFYDRRADSTILAKSQGWGWGSCFSFSASLKLPVKYARLI